jgi:hypothetical protein
MLVALEVHMSEENLELLITLDDPGEDNLEEDTFHDPQPENTSKRRDVIVDKDRSKFAV